MRCILPVLAAGLLLGAQPAQAQGYSGVMPAQQGYRSAPAAAAPQGAMNPYGGTGASDVTGYAAVTPGDDAGLPRTEPAMAPPDPDAAPPPTSAYAASFGRKNADGDPGSAGVSIYDAVEANATDPGERRRQGILHKVDAARKKAQRELDRANEERDRQVRETVRQTVVEERRKMRGGDEDDGSEDDQPLDQPDMQDQPEEQAADELAGSANPAVQ